MKNTLVKSIIIIILAIIQPFCLIAQDGSAKATEKGEEGPTIRFNGLGRSFLANTGISGNILDSDTTTVKSLTDGEFLLDIALNATPNEKTEVQTILRLRNEFGGFFGSGMSVEVRELWARGIISDFLKYRVGDMDLAMTPFTLFNADEEGSINEAAIFKPQKEVIYYENFFTNENTRRLQGAKIDFGFDFTSFLEDVDVSAFIARIRGTDFFTTPSRFITGGQMDFSTMSLNDSLGMKADFGINLTHTFDDLKTGNATDGIRNTVYSLDFDFTVLDKKNMAISLTGETGKSNLEQKEDSISVFKEDDTFLDVNLKLHLKKQNISLNVGYVDVGPDFFSMGAQSKRIDYQAAKTNYNRIGEERFVRKPSLFDISRDRALYTFQLSDRLMNYDPRFSNTSPYGAATPNRRGIKLGVGYGGSNDKINANIGLSLLSEIRGQGTFELKDFTLIRFGSNINLHKIANLEKNLKLTIGYQYETTSRGGVEIEQVDLKSNLIDLGLEAEVFSNFELLFGAKMLTSKGKDYIPTILEFNDVKDFPSAFLADDTETLLAAGIKYEFKKGVYLTMQYQSFKSNLGENNPNDYNFNQIFALYNMNF
jgi:hypothetical protein